MTTQEAIDTLKIAIAEVEWNYPLDHAVAMEMAIKALEKEIPTEPVIQEEEILFRGILFLINISAVLLANIALVWLTMLIKQGKR